MKKSETITEFSKAFAKMQSELEQPLKNANNPFFKSKYVPLENVVSSITKAASKNGLSFTQFPSSDEQGNITVGTIVMHESGEWIEYDPIKMKPAKSDPQGVGSAITYAKRYALSAIFGITSDQDDDGNEASRSTSKSAEMIDQVTYNDWMSRLEKVSAMTGWSVSSLVNRISKEIGKAPEVALVTDKVKVDKFIEMSEAKAREEMMKGE